MINIEPIIRRDYFVIRNIVDQLKMGPDNFHTQFNWYPRVLVIGPGGIKGLKTLGFLSPLADAELFKYTDTYCGVSVGALICLLMVCGYEIREIVGEIATIDLLKDLDPVTFHPTIEQKGLLSNEPVKRKLIQLVLNKFGSIPTLYSLYLKTGKSLAIVTLNATDNCCEIMDPFTDPNISCIEATMFSMNIPFRFYQLIYQGKIYVDGSLANPYPVDYFDDRRTNILAIYMRYREEKSKSETEEFKPHVIIQKLAQSQYLAQYGDSLELGRYYSKLMSSMMDQRRNEIISISSDKCKHICLETKIVDSLGYSITIEDKAEMLVEGFNEGKQFLMQLEHQEFTNPEIEPIGKYSYPTYYLLEDNQEIKTQK